MPTFAGWTAALAEHRDVLSTCSEVLASIPDARWDQPASPGKWSPAAVTLHLGRAYEFTRDAITTGATMKRLLPAPVSWGLRTFMLPRLLARQSFPRGARSPVEVIPDIRDAEGIGRAALMTRLGDAAAEAADVLHRADSLKPRPRVIHAYFGPMSPLLALRMLSGHTRHHTLSLTHLMGA